MASIPCPDCHNQEPAVDACDTCCGNGTVRDPDDYEPRLDGPGVERYTPAQRRDLRDAGRRHWNA